MTIYSLWRTPFSIWNQSVSWPVLTVASWPAYRFLKRHVRWSGIPISFRIFHSLLWSTQSRLWYSQWRRNRFFLELSCFFDDPAEFGNLISGSSAFSKTSWTFGSSLFTYCWRLAWRILSITLLTCEMTSFSWVLSNSSKKRKFGHKRSYQGYIHTEKNHEKT